MWGLFANEKIMKGAFVIEYKGEIISEDLTNIREEYYNYVC